MKRSRSTPAETGDKEKGGDGAKASGRQTLLRGLNVLEAVADGIEDLQDLSEAVGLTRSTTYRLAAALVERRYLNFTPRAGYKLGPKLLQLGSIAQAQTALVQTARPLLEDLSARTSDTVHLGVLDADSVLYLDKIAGGRRVEVSSRIGERQPLTPTGLGKALLLDDTGKRWRELFDRDEADVFSPRDYDVWAQRMQGYVDSGCAYDLEENEDQIRCVAAPIRDAGDRIVAAISLSSARQYMDDDRMAQVGEEVMTTAREISELLGWEPRKKR